METVLGVDGVMVAVECNAVDVLAATEDGLAVGDDVPLLNSCDNR